MRQRLTQAAAALAVIGIGSASLPTPAHAQWTRIYLQAPLPSAQAGSFAAAYADHARVLNAAEFAEAKLFGSLAAGRGSEAEIEGDHFGLVTGKLRANPPALQVSAAAADPGWARLAPQVVAMLEWARLLERQLYDAAAAEGLSEDDRNAAIAELVAYYKSRRDLAVSSVPKAFDIADGQYFSLAFRKGLPRSNGAMWAAQWLRLGLFEALLDAASRTERDQRVDATVRRYWELVDDALRNAPRLMPMATAVAPTFARRYPEVGIILDNVGMLHGVISDILVSSEIPRGLERDEILRMAELFRGDTAHAIPLDAWLAMGPMIGAGNMGGLAATPGAPLPTPTVPLGLSLASPATGAPPGAPEMPAMDHSAMGMAPSGGAATGGMDHTGMGVTAGGVVGGGTGDPSQTMQQMTMAQMMAMHERMLADPVIRERMATDPVLLRMMQDMTGMGTMPGMGAMQGMAMPAPDSLAPEDRARAIDFVVRLLSDPMVERRLRNDPALRQIWSDPALQRRLEELRSRR